MSGRSRYAGGEQAGVDHAGNGGVVVDRCLDRDAESGFDVEGVSENFDKILGQHLQHVGMTMPDGMEHKK